MQKIKSSVMRRVYALILIIGMAATAAAQQRLASVTPLPTKVEFSDTPATLDVERGLRLYIEGAAEESERLAEAADATGIALKRVNRPAKERYLNLRVTDSAEQGAEGYTLDVTERGVTITASTPAGIFYGLQSLRQMNDGEVECCTITDAPRFAYRGILIDISRHFRTKEFLMRQIDMMAQLKMNRLHLHLTDAAGWRIELHSPHVVRRVAHTLNVEGVVVWRAPARRGGYSWRLRRLPDKGGGARAGGVCRRPLHNDNSRD